MGTSDGRLHARHRGREVAAPPAQGARWAHARRIRSPRQRRGLTHGSHRDGERAPGGLMEGQDMRALVALAAVLATMTAWSGAEAAEARITSFVFGCETPEGRKLSSGTDASSISEGSSRIGQRRPVTASRSSQYAETTRKTMVLATFRCSSSAVDDADVELPSDPFSTTFHPGKSRCRSATTVLSGSLPCANDSLARGRPFLVKTTLP